MRWQLDVFERKLIVVFLGSDEGEVRLVEATSEEEGLVVLLLEAPSDVADGMPVGDVLEVELLLQVLLQGFGSDHPVSTAECCRR